jgi:ubiquinone/menaquinone biosynthesis C-methylase UbiE
MGWYYDVFSSFYDSSLEPLYREQRKAAAAALQLSDGDVVLDLPCGTGQSFDELTAARVVGVDASAGMLRKARARAERLGMEPVLLQADARTLSADELSAAGAPANIDRLHIFLGLTAFPDWTDAFANLWGLLRPGGRCVVVDVHADPLTFQGRMVNLVARADIRRRFWEPLEAVAEGYERSELPSLPDHGGQLYLCAGNKPG